jgi:hypothetical protein
MPEPDPVVLLSFITKSFSLEELKTLCFQLYVPFDDLPGDGREAKARELIALMQRVDRLPDLSAALARERSEQYRRTFGSTPHKPPKRTPHARNPRQVFISHAHQDAKFAHRLANDLQRENYEVWIAPDSILLGELWVDAINRALRESGIFLLVSTPDAVDSEWVQEETNYALGLVAKRLVRFIRLDVKEADAEPFWTTRQYVSFRHKYSVGLKQLLAALQDSVPTIQQEQRTPPSTTPATKEVEAGQTNEAPAALAETKPATSTPSVSTEEAIQPPPVTPDVTGRLNIPVWGWVIGIGVLVALIVWASLAFRGPDNDDGVDDETSTPEAIQVVEGVDETIIPTQPPTATIASIPTPVPTLIPIQSWTHETEFSVAQGWDILVDADGEAGFEDGKFFIANKKKNLLYISLWDELGGNVNNAVFSVDLIEPGKSEAPNAAGLVFGWGPDSEDPTFAFLVTEDDGCEFRQESNNRWTRVSQGQTSNFNQQQESHTVSVVIKDGHAYGFVDGLYCDDNVFPLYEAGYIGVAALSGIDQEDGSKGYFDNARFANLP